MKAQDQNRRRKSMLITLGVHSALLAIAMIPVGYHIENKMEEDSPHVVTIEFAEFAESTEEALQAKSPVADPEVKPVTENVNNQPEIVEAEVVEEVTETTEETEPIESDVTEEVESEVTASEDNYEGAAEENVVSGGSEATTETGESEGTEVTGETEGQNGLDGTGVITRKIIHREDITQVARYTGIIAVNVCIDRRGYVTAAAMNDERTTITDIDLLREALDITTGYRFETDYTAAIRECGVLTFVFDIDEEMYADYVVTD